MRGALDLVLVRRAAPSAQDALPFDVYVGDGRVEALRAHLAEHPRATYVDVEARLRDLAVGPYGQHAGDVLFLAHNGEEPTRRAASTSRASTARGTAARRGSTPRSRRSSPTPGTRAA
jgi:hypothetical protein